MEWRAIPGYPGYEVNRKGIIRNAVSGNIYGQNPNLYVKGKFKWANGPKLARTVFDVQTGDAPPLPSPFVVPADAAPAPEPASEDEKGA
jgi:hypothetical protein